ncbi:MAG: NirD/YgiW/YdeI family stress tolerance protein, partial [Deltaproteobacteria bacterium]|nr:NirD/YgiW/YdeI family stress tolerance protein [Deltaproteobacteria bacterium]
MKANTLRLVPASLAIAALAFCGTAFAQGGGFQAPPPQTSGGGFTGGGDPTVTVEQAKNMRDDSDVRLTGKIVQHLGKDKYLFLDGTGDVVVEIDHDKWGGVNATPETSVVLYGEVDRDWNGVEIDVDRV